VLTRGWDEAQGKSHAAPLHHWEIQVLKSNLMMCRVRWMKEWSKGLPRIFQRAGV
jgi:hypothetical protein